MARKVIEQYICDMCESEDAVESVVFAYAGKPRQIDLCAKDRKAFDAALGPFLADATEVKAQRGNGRAPRGSGVAAKQASRDERAAISAFEVAEGREALFPRGRVNSAARERWIDAGSPSVDESTQRQTNNAQLKKSARKAAKAPAAQFASE